MKRLLPDHIDYTARQWRARFRSDLRDLKRSLQQLRLGCAYSPILKNVNAIREQIADAEQKLRGTWKP